MELQPGPVLPSQVKRRPGASGGPGAAKAKAKAKDEDDDLVDSDADRPNFGTAADEDEAGEEADEDADGDDAFASVAARAGAKSAKAAKKKTERKPLDPAYVTVGVMAIWIGRSILMEMWPGISGL